MILHPGVIVNEPKSGAPSVSYTPLPYAVGRIRLDNVHSTNVMSISWIVIARQAMKMCGVRPMASPRTRPRIDPGHDH